MIRQMELAPGPPLPLLPQAALVPGINSGPFSRTVLRQFPSEMLVKRIRNGDARAFEILVDRYEKRLFRIVLGILKDPDDAVEVVQDVFMTAFRKIDTFREEASFSTWIHRIAVNAALMHRRRDKSSAMVPLEKVLPSFDERGRALEHVEDWSEQADDPVLQEEIHQVIQAAVNRLDEKYKVVFVLREVEGISTEDTARITGLSVAAVKTRLHRARLQLRKELADYFEVAQTYY